MKKRHNQPTDNDYKFAEWAIEAHYAMYEQTGEFPFRRALEKLTQDVRKIREERTGLPAGSMACERFINRLAKSKEATR